MRKSILVFYFVMCFSVISAFAGNHTRFMSDPDIHGDSIVFTFENDLWLSDTHGGNAMRITSFPGNEYAAHFSPDGEWIAFSGSYDGQEAVYLIPSKGGTPRRISYNPGGARVIDWTRDGRQIIISSYMKTFIYRDPRLFTIDVAGSAPVQMAMDRGVYANFHEDGKQLLYCRKGNPEYQWKRYKGGRYVDIWLYNTEDDSFKAISDYVGKNAYPMWIGDTMYFISDRDSGITNMYKQVIPDGTVNSVTAYDTFDVMMAGTDGKQIIYVQDGYLHVLDPITDQSRKLEVHAVTDQWKIRSRKINPKNYIHSMDIPNEGENIVLEARGDIFLIPSDKGQTRNLTGTSGVRERLPKISPDGKSIAYFSDQSGDYQLYIRNVETGKVTPLTDSLVNFTYRPVWSPDGKKILFGDKSFAVYYVDIATRQLTKVGSYNQLKNDEFFWEIDDYGWSPDSNWVCYSSVAYNKNSVVHLYSLESGKTFDVTDDFYDNLNPRFDTGGEYLYYMSSRNFDLHMDFYEDNHVIARPYQIMAVQLKKGQKPPFMDDEDKEDKSDKEKEAPFRVDIDNLTDRTFPLPVDSGNYFYMKAGKGKVAWCSVENFTENEYDVIFKPGRDSRWTLHMFDMKKEKEVKVDGKIREFLFSNNGEQTLIRKSNDFYTLTTKDLAKSKKIKDKANLSQMVYEVDTLKEFNQIFSDAWRWYRDFFYDGNMHGQDWKVIGDRYRAFIPYLSNRQGLNWLMSQMVGELCVGHAYIGGGDYNQVEQNDQLAGVYAGYLGADFVPDSKSDRFRFERILGPTRINRDLKGPLARPDMDIKKGDYLIAINGHDVRAGDDFHQYLQVVRGQKVDVTVNSKPVLEGASTYSVEPLRSERSLRYFRWITDNIDYVLKKTDGRVGYMHITNMGDAGVGQFDKYWRAFRYKEGIVIDMRRNSGGWTEYFLIDKLERQQIAFNVLKEMEPHRYPGSASVGKFVAVSNEYNGSDGEAFIEHFKARNLGKVVGMPSWGGLVGIINGQLTIDNGRVHQPNNSFYGKEQKWWVENHGADPDILMDNDPASVLMGKDNQLDKAIEVMLKEIEMDKTPALPPVPEYQKK